MMGKVYIQAAEQISIQNPLSEAWMEEPIVYHEPFVKAVNPAFREYIAPNEARRMGNIMGHFVEGAEGDGYRAS